MKKSMVFGILSALSTLASGDTCPRSVDIFKNIGGKIVVVSPPGWFLLKDDRQLNSFLDFSVAAWGDHRHDTSPVRCHYYLKNEHVELESAIMFAESKIVSHPEWSRSGTDHYHLCTSRSVAACPFN